MPIRFIPAWRGGPLLLALLVLLSGCQLGIQDVATPIQFRLGTPESSATDDANALPGGLSDAREVLAGICFESAWDAAGRVFVLRSLGQLNQLFDLADQSELCLRPVARVAHDFRDGAVIAGLWSRGMGCTARHEWLAYSRDDEEKRVRLALRFITEGTCNYELVRPFWVEIPGAPDYQIEITVE